MVIIVKFTCKTEWQSDFCCYLINMATLSMIGEYLFADVLKIFAESTEKI